MPRTKKKNEKYDAKVKAKVIPVMTGALGAVLPKTRRMASANCNITNLYPEQRITENSIMCRTLSHPGLW